MAQLPIAQFLTARLKEYDPKFELRSGTGFEQLFFKPVQFITQPLLDEANDIRIAQSFRLILQQENPDDFDQESVDALASNLFVFRRDGNKSSGTGRVYFNLPVDREYTAGGAQFVGANGATFSNPAPFKILQAEMNGNLEDGLYYLDVPVIADVEGPTGTLEIGELIQITNDSEAVRVTNLAKFSVGLDTETNTQLIARAQESVGVRDLVTGKGFNAILFENFAGSLLEAQPIGFGDDEMMRDILYNVHVGGRVDGYVKTSEIRIGSKDFVGVLIDPTRQTGTATNLMLSSTDPAEIGSPNLDRSNNLAPIVTEIKPAVPAKVLILKDFTSTVNLSSTQHIRLGIDGTFKDIRIAGANPASTTRNEIVNLINFAMGRNVAFPVGNSFYIQSPTTGLASSVTIMNPTVGNSALLTALNLATSGSPYTYTGDGPVTYVEGVHYTVDDDEGTIKRVIGTLILGSQTQGAVTTGLPYFTQVSPSIFLNVQPRDILTIDTGPLAGDYRVLLKPNLNTLVLDTTFDVSLTDLSYSIRRTGIKNGEMIYMQYWYNPLSIDIGNQVNLDAPAPLRPGSTPPVPQPIKNRGIRPDREEWTITDMAFLRVKSVELIDAITGEPTGDVLNGDGGYGRGGYGMGGYGIGAGADYFLHVNSPHERFSAFEDSYLVFGTEFQGQSFRVTYEYVPEVVEYHNFVRTERERVLDGDILMKHSLPAYVSGEIQYKADPTNSATPDNETLTDLLKDFVNTRRAGTPLIFSEVMQKLIRAIDPFDRYNTTVVPFTLRADIHNMDGSLTKIVNSSQLEIPSEPFPKDSPRPLTPRITHWVADNIILTRLS